MSRFKDVNMLVILTESERVKFWGSVAKTDTCWNWIKRTDPKGYGQLNFRRHDISSHRLSWLIHKGSIGNLCVLHHCDNPRCVNPDHLFLGTRADNVADKVKKGRQAKGPTHSWAKHPEWIRRGERHWMFHGRNSGEDQHQAKLTNAQVLAIDAKLKAGATGLQLAAEFGVSDSAISLIKLRKTWRRVLA